MKVCTFVFQVLRFTLRPVVPRYCPSYADHGPNTAGNIMVLPGSDNTRQTHGSILYASNFRFIFANRRLVQRPSTLRFMQPKLIPSTVTSDDQRLI
jgi:hypothetical protein